MCLLKGHLCDDEKEMNPEKKSLEFIFNWKKKIPWGRNAFFFFKEKPQQRMNRVQILNAKNNLPKKKKIHKNLASTIIIKLNLNCFLNFFFFFLRLNVWFRFPMVIQYKKIYLSSHYFWFDKSNFPGRDFKNENEEIVKENKPEKKLHNKVQISTEFLINSNGTSAGILRRFKKITRNRLLSYVKSLEWFQKC